MIERLERIEALQRGDAPAGALLAELRGLLRDGEAWLAAEAGSTAGAAAALEGCRGRVRERREVAPKV